MYAGMFERQTVARLGGFPLNNKACLDIWRTREPSLERCVQMKNGASVKSINQRRSTSLISLLRLRTLSCTVCSRGASAAAVGFTALLQL